MVYRIVAALMLVITPHLIRAYDGWTYQEAYVVCLLFSIYLILLSILDEIKK